MGTNNMKKSFLPCLQSRSQSPQAFWSAGGRRERLWGNGKILIFLMLFKAVHSNKTKNR